MTITIPAFGTLHAALQACHPAGLPDWLISASPRCGGAAEPLHLDEHQAEELADLTAAVLWECQQDPDSDPLSRSFASVCEETLNLLERARS
jgi:hypothetical protein